MPPKDRSVRLAIQRRYRQSENGRKRRREYQSEWAKTEKGKAVFKRYRDANIDLVRAKSRESYDAHYFRLRAYGLSSEDYARLLATQEGRCPICGHVKQLVVDHNHATGKVRALLCYRCNSLLAGVEDVEWRNRAVEYLQRHASV